MSRPTLDSVIAAAIEQLRQAGIVSPATDARLLIAAALGSDRAALITQGQRPVSPEESALIDSAIARRRAREPVARIIGQREFWDLPFTLSPDTLEPRPDSETLIEAGLARIDDRLAPLTIADLGTGTGCLLLALLSELPNARGIGIDIAPGAAQCAQANAMALGLADRALCGIGDWAAALPGSWFDTIVMDSPYVPVKTVESLVPEVSFYDQLVALAGGADGLAAYPTIAAESHRALRPRGWLHCECGDKQAKPVQSILMTAGFVQIEQRTDLAGRPRCISGRKPG